MKWTGFMVMVLFLCSCGNDENDATTENPDRFSLDGAGRHFPKVEVPYELTEEELKKNQKAELPEDIGNRFLPDSLKKELKGTAPIKYFALAQIPRAEAETYLIMKAVKGKNLAAYIVLFDQQKNHAATFPFLIPDNDATTTHSASIDSRYAVTRAAVRRRGAELLGEGKDVYAWDQSTQAFTWIMTDLLDEDQELLNPIDTLPSVHKLAGDYIRDKRNAVFIRDGRYPNQLTVYIHTEKNKGDCKGELKGNFLVTSSNTAVYRESGDPCVLQLKISGSRLTLSEEQGCGNYRGLDCPFNGTFTKKKKATASSKERKS